MACSASRKRHITNNLEAQLFGEKIAAGMGNSGAQTRKVRLAKQRMRNEQLVPHFNPDTDLVWSVPLPLPLPLPLFLCHSRKNGDDNNHCNQASASSQARLFYGSFVMLSQSNDARQYLTADYDSKVGEELELEGLVVLVVMRLTRMSSSA